MPNSQIPSSITERRLAIAHRLYEALVGQDPDRAIILCNTSGKVVTRHDPRLERVLRRLPDKAAHERCVLERNVWVQARPLCFPASRGT